MIDNQGRIKKTRWNIIDFCIVMFFVVILAVVLYAITVAPNFEEKVLPATHYTIHRTCPNCKKGKRLKIPFGQLIPKEWIDVCEIKGYKGCGNKVVFIKPKPKPKPKPKEINHERLYYKRLRKEKGWLE